MMLCTFCDEPLADDPAPQHHTRLVERSGVLVAEPAGAHRECVFRNVMGSARHIATVHEHGGCDGTCIDDPTLTRREQAIAAWTAYLKLRAWN